MFVDIAVIMCECSNTKNYLDGVKIQSAHITPYGWPAATTNRGGDGGHYSALLANEQKLMERQKELEAKRKQKEELLGRSCPCIAVPQQLSNYNGTHRFAVGKLIGSVRIADALFSFVSFCFYG